jgi:tetratricopeptide (TPR) repeat protein
VKADAVRKGRIDDLVDTFMALDAKRDGSPVLREMTRILSEEGVDAALAYIDGQRGSVLDRIKARAEAVQAQNRAELQPLLQAAGLHAAKGQNDAARMGYRDVLSMEPQWPEALEVFGWFLVDQSIHSMYHRTISVAVVDCQEALSVAQVWISQDPKLPIARRLLAAALDACGDVYKLRGQAGDADHAFEAFTKSLALRDENRKDYPASILLMRDYSLTLNRLAEFLIVRGLPGDFEAAWDHSDLSLKICERVLEGSPDSPDAMRDVSISLNKMGDYFLARAGNGDIDQALADYNRGLELAVRAAAANPDSANATRDVAISQGKIGSALAVRAQPGDRTQALDYLARCLVTHEARLKASPESTQAARDVSVCLERMGDVLAARARKGDLDQAFEKFGRCLEIREAILKVDHDSAQVVRDLFVVVNKMGDLLMARKKPGDAEQALADYTRSLELADKLMAANPGSAQEIRDVSICLNRLGEELPARNQPGDSDKALEYLNRSLTLAEGLLAATPGWGQTARDVSVTLNKLGVFLSARGLEGDLDLALRHYARSLEICERIVKEDPTSRVAQRDVFVCLNRLGIFLYNHGKPENAELALGYATRSLEMTEALLKADPDSVQSGRDVCISLSQLAAYHQTHGQPELAATYWSRRTELSAKLDEVSGPGVGVS